MKKKKDGTRIFIYFCLPLIWLISAKGVYGFLIPFVGPIIAVITAIVFDAIPLAILLMHPRKNEVRTVLVITGYSTVIAVVFNILDGFLSEIPGLRENTPVWLDSIVVIAHGLLVPVLGFLVTWFVFHRSADDQEQNNPIEKSEIQILTETLLSLQGSPSQKRLPAPGTSGTRIEWPDHIDQMLATMSNVDIAKELKCGTPAVRRLRRKRGIPVPLGGHHDQSVGTHDELGAESQTS